MNKKLRLITAILIVFSLLLTSLGSALAEGGKVETALDARKSVFASDGLYTLAKQGGEEWVGVSLILSNGADVSGLVDQLILRKPIAGIQAATGRVKAEALGKLASNEGVLSIRPLVVEKPATMQPVPPDAEKALLTRGARGLLKGLGAPLKLNKSQATVNMSAETGLSSYKGVDVLGAKAAWNLGFKGKDVIVGQVDDGIDFGHPDLEGTWAVIKDMTSPYYGWPMVYDPGPALLYVGYGETFNWENLWDGTLGGLYSYYVDTSYVPAVTIGPSGLTATAVITTVGYSDPPDYTEPAILANTYTFSNSSKSGAYHAGIHPESYLTIFNEPGEYVAVLLVDEKTAGVYDTVYVDWDSSHSFDSYERFSQEHPTGWYYDAVSESWSRDVTGDAVADISAGILYWIADGENLIPGTDTIYLPQYLDPPTNGDLVLFYGNYNGNSHGTGTGAAVVAQGKLTSTLAADGTQIPAWADVSGGSVFGSAPEAKIFSSNLFSVGSTDIDSWVVHAVGYDGRPGTGDEAQVDTNSWGNIGREDAWSSASRVITWLNAQLPYTTWLFGTANGGTGYGTSHSPGTSPTAIGVAGYDLNGTTLNQNEPIAGVDQLIWGDLTPFSSRGPNTAGRGDADIMAIADGATGDLPLLHVPLTAGVVDGQLAWEEFGGTSQATPFVAGVAALVCQAYKSAHGMWPDYAALKDILKSSATDANNDPFVQGAGRVNAEKAVQVAAGLASFYVSPSDWDAGSYRGEKYADFARLVAPGSSDAQTFVVHNTGTTTLTLSISDSALAQIGEWEMVLTTTADAEELARNNSKPDYIVPLYLKGGVNHIPEGADLMIVQSSIPWDKFSMGDPTIPASMTVDSLWYMKVLNWKDLNGNGVLWNDANGNGAVNNGELDNPPATGIADLDNSSQEINEFNLSYGYGTTKECRVEKPLARADDGLYIGLMHYTSAARQVGKPFPETPISIRVTFYKQMDVPWITSSPATLTIGAHMTGTFVSTVTIPADQAPGLYQGSIRVGNGTAHESNIPVVANVPAAVTASNLNFSFGGQDPSGAPYDNSYIYGGFDWLGNGWHDQGDWRMYFVDVPNDVSLPTGARWIVDTKWQSPRTDIDTRMVGPTNDAYSDEDLANFGPYTLDIVGGSQDTLFDRGDVFGWGGYGFAWKTNTGKAQETVTADLLPGLNGIGLQNVLYGGIAPRERFTGTVGTVSVAPYPIKATVTTLTGSATITFTSSIALDGLGYGGSFGLSKPMDYADQTITQNGQKTFRFTVTNSALLDLRLSTKEPARSKDLDLNLYQAIGGKWVKVGSSAGTTSDEYIRIVRPMDGQYMAQVVGYSVVGTGHFDLVIRSVEGSDITVTGLPTGPIAAGTPYQLQVNYAKTQASGDYQGLILLGTSDAPTILEVPVEITFNIPDLSDSTSSVSQTQAMVNDKLRYTIAATNTGTGAGQISVLDYLPKSAAVTFLPASLTASQGAAIWEPTQNDGYGMLHWDGQLSIGQTITITFEMQVNKVGASTLVTNTVIFRDYANPDVTTTTTTRVNIPNTFMPMINKK